MKKPEKNGIKLSKRAEKIAKEFSLKNNIPVEQFIEEAIVEKVEYEEIKTESGAEALDEMAYSYFEERDMFRGEQDDFKKKH